MRGFGTYILVDGQPVLEPDVIKWSAWMEAGDNRRAIAQTPIEEITRLDKVLVSTVFLGLNHNFLAKGAPILFETMIFGGPHDEDMWRYTSKAAALEGHEKAVELVKAEELGPREWSPRRKGGCSCGPNRKKESAQG